jgi:hypothetical protein
MGKVSTLITTIILVSLVFTGFTTFLSGLQSEYDFEIEENYTGTYDALEMNAILEEEGMDYGSMADASGNFEEGQHWYSFFDTIWKNIAGSFGIISNTGDVAKNMVREGLDVADTPAWLESGVIALITILIILLIAGLISNRNL